MAKESEVFSGLENYSKTKKTLELMKRYGVLFDLDGVKVASSYGAVKIYNLKWGMRFGLVKSVEEHVSYYAMTGWLKTIKGNNDGLIDDPLKEASDIWNDEENLKNSPTELGILPLMRLMYDYGIDPHDATSRPKSTKEVTEYWIRTKFAMFGDLTGNLHFQEGMLPNMMHKAEVIKELKIPFIFEDHGEHAEKEAEAGAIVGLVLKPWSRNYIPKSELIVKPTKYQGRDEIIRTFLSVCDFVDGNPGLVVKVIDDLVEHRSHNIDIELVE